MPTIALVGAAHCHTPWIVGELSKRHDVQIKYVSDHDLERGRGVAGTAHARYVEDSRTIWSDPEVDGVFVLSETDRHLNDVLCAARAKKPIFVEKPLGLNARDSFRMASAIAEAGIPFMTGYRTRSEGVFVYLRGLIASGALGQVTRVRYITCHGGLLTHGFPHQHAWMTDPTHAGGGAFFDLGSHAVDTVLWMLGQKPVRATSMTGRVRAMSAQGCDHYGEGLIEFGDGTLASVAAAWVDFDQPIRCTITGTEGHACVHGHGGPLYLKTPHVRGADGTRPFTEVPGDRPLCFDLFIDALAQNQAVEYITAAEAANVDAVHDAMRRGAAEKTWVDCPWFG